MRFPEERGPLSEIIRNPSKIGQTELDPEEWMGFVRWRETGWQSEQKQELWVVKCTQPFSSISMRIQEGWHFKHIPCKHVISKSSKQCNK